MAYGGYPQAMLGVAMATQLSLRQLWVTYMEFAAPVIATRYRRLIARHSFYAGAESALAVLDKMLEDGEYETLHRAIQRHGRRLRVIYGSGQPRKRRH
jgi:hypothetical protein